MRGPTTHSLPVTREMFGMYEPRAKSGRELVAFLQAAFACASAFEAMRAREPSELQAALCDERLEFAAKRCLQRVLRLRRAGKMTFEAFWPAYFD